MVLRPFAGEKAHSQGKAFVLQMRVVGSGMMGSCCRNISAGVRHDVRSIGRNAEKHRSVYRSEWIAERWFSMPAQRREFDVVSNPEFLREASAVTIAAYERTLSDRPGSSRSLGRLSPNISRQSPVR